MNYAKVKEAFFGQITLFTEIHLGLCNWQKTYNRAIQKAELYVMLPKSNE